jgi:hypothetical protein
MPNTTNYSFPTPADTDLVKNGADAIRDLGDAVDTAMNTALGTKKAGMVLLNTTSFSAVASQSVNDVFSATYKMYKILLNTTSAANTLEFRFRVAGADNSTSNYNTVVLNARSGNATGLQIASEGNTLTRFMNAQGSTVLADLSVSNPFDTQKTCGIVNLSSESGSAGYRAELQTGAFNFAATTSFTGFTFLFGANNSGTITVYGVNQ